VERNEDKTPYTWVQGAAAALVSAALIAAVDGWIRYSTDISANQHRINAVHEALVRTELQLQHLERESGTRFAELSEKVGVLNGRVSTLHTMRSK
jgi:hypothetical protein